MVEMDGVDQLLRSLRRPMSPDGWRVRLMPVIPAGLATLAFGKPTSSPTLLARAVSAWLAFFLLLRANVSLERQRDGVSDTRDQVFALWSLLGLISPDRRLQPALGDFALDARRAHGLLSAVTEAEPGVVVELGPGTSTVLLDYVNRTLSKRFEHYALEHDEGFAQATRSLLCYHEITDVLLVEAPLEEQQVGNWSGQWYRRSAFSELPTMIDFLVIDGPPGHLGSQSRYPALPMLRSRLTIGAMVFLDDTHRAGERQILDRWITDDPTLSVKHDGGSYVILTVTP